MAVVLVKNLPRSAGAPGGEIAARIAAGRNDSFFYVAPTKRKVRQLGLEFLSEAPGRVSGPFPIFTLGTLSEALYDILLPPPPLKKRLGDRMRAAVVQEAIRTCADGLAYFTLRGPARRLPRGTLARIANVINRLKSSGVYLSTIQDEIGEGGPGERLKLRDIALIYETYERLLAEGGYVDPPGIVEAVNLEWTKPGSDLRFRERHPAVDLLAVTGFDEFSDPELTLLGYLSGVPGLGTVVSFDYHPDNDHLFGHLKENYTKLLAMGFAAAGSPVGGMSPFHAHIARNLFAPGPARGGAGPFDASSIVTACAAPDRVREAELIAKIIRTEIADTPGLGPADVCVCMPRPEAYSAVFREVFEQAGIPANVTDRFYLEESSVVAGLVSVLQVAQNNFRIEDIMRAGTNPFFRIPAGAGGAFDAPNLLRTASELRTVSGRKRWVERIEARLRFLRAAHPGGEESGTRRERAEAARLNDARRDIDALDRLVSGLRAPMRPGEFRDAVAGLAAALGVPESLAAAGSSGVPAADVERESRAFAEFLGFLDEFPEVLSIESPPGEAHPLSWYLERFRPLLSQVRYNVRQRYGGGVLVTSIDETRGLAFRVMVVAGLVDGEFPSVYEPEVFLTPKSRQRRERYHLHGQRYLFYQALSGCSGRLYLTRPLKENGVDLNPSGFLEWLEASTSIAKPGPDGPGPYAQTIVTADDLLSMAVEAADRAAASGAAATGAEATTPEVPERVRTAIAAEEARRRDSGADPFRGVLDPAALAPGAAARLAAYRNGTYSVTQLETYGDCPFRFFAGRVLGLRTPEEPEEGVTPREMGKLLHEILYDFYTDRRDRGLPPIAGIDDDGFAGAVAALKEIAARKFDEASVDDVFWEISRETVIGSLGSQGSPGSPGRPGTPGTLEAMLAGERASGVSAKPAWFEVRFGRAGEDLKYSDPGMFSDEPAPAGGIFLQGKIDRIDADGDAFAVVDYKTGSTIPAKKAVEEGDSLQLPLYLHCAEWLLSGRLGRPMAAGAGLYYHLKPEFEAVARIGNAEYRGSLLDPSRKFRLASDAAALRLQIDAAIATAGERAERISRGLFPVEPRDPATICRSCDYNRMCRIRTRMSPDPGPEGGDDGPRDNERQTQHGQYGE